MTQAVLSNKYTANRMQFEELEKRVTLPAFQRKLVWSKNQKEAFIKTLNNKFPFGSILIYRYGDEGDKNKFSLIDGLQRYTTILDFKLNPTNYIKFDKFVDEICDLLNLDDIPNRTIQHYREQINKDIISVVQLGKGQVIGTELYKMLESKLPFDQNLDLIDIIPNIQAKIIKYVIQYLDVSKIEIPYIEFTGNQSELAEVFQNLNMGGKKLTKYQVFAAQWSKNEFKLSEAFFSTKILKLIIERYNNLEKNRDIEIEGFDSEEMEKNRIINMSEFCYGLGMLIIGKMPVFWKNDDNEELANEIGYSTLAIVLGLKNKDMPKIIEKEYLFKLSSSNDFKESLISAIVKEYAQINGLFESRLRIRGTNPARYFSSSPSNFQIMSYFSSLWTLKYGEINTTAIEKKSKYQSNYDAVLKNFLNYYLYDIITKRWSGSGDSKLDDITFTNNRYIKKMDISVLEDSANQWWEERKDVASINFDNISKLIFVVFASYYPESYGNGQYDFEHLVPRSRVFKYYKTLGISAGSLGNLMLLDYRDNRSKKDKTLYENETELMCLSSGFLDEISYPSKSQLAESIISLERGDAEIMNKMFDSRAKSLLNSFIKELSR